MREDGDAMRDGFDEGGTEFSEVFFLEGGGGERFKYFSMYLLVMMRWGELGVNDGGFVGEGAMDGG